MKLTPTFDTKTSPRGAIDAYILHIDTYNRDSMLYAFAKTNKAELGQKICDELIS